MTLHREMRGKIAASGHPLLQDRLATSTAVSGPKAQPCPMDTHLSLCEEVGHEGSIHGILQGAV